MTPQNFQQLRRKAPQLIVIGIIIAAIVYIVFDFFEDVVIGGAPVTSEPIISLILSITRGVTSIVRAFGYTGIFGLMVLESSSLPIPSEVILPFAGYLSVSGQFNFWVIVGVSTAAGIVGALVDYYIGSKGVEVLIKHKILGKTLLSTAQLEVAEKWFKKYGDFMVFVSRVIPGLRTTFSFPAGAAKMPLKKFVAYTALGCLTLNLTLVYFGLYLGKNWAQVAGVSRYLLVAAVIAVAIAVAVFVVRSRRKKTVIADEARA